MNELTTTAKKLPETIEEKTAYVLFGPDALKAYRTKLSEIKEKYGISSEQYKQIQLEAQETAENVLLYSVDVGNYIQKNIPKGSGGDHGNQYTGGKSDVNDNFAKTKNKAIHDMGFTARQARDFQTLAKNQDKVQAAIEYARKNDRIVTRQDVFNRIVPSKSKSQSMREILMKAEDEHEAFKEAKKEGLVNFKDIKTDKMHENLLVANTRVKFSKIVKAFSDFEMTTSQSDIEEVVKASSSDELDNLKRKIDDMAKTLCEIKCILEGKECKTKRLQNLMLKLRQEAKNP